jgi:MoxR-like ATPase
MIEIYQSGRVKAPVQPNRLPSPPAELIDNPANYFCSERLARVVNVALLLGQPLLVTGEPGTGKTQLAHSIAWQLGLGKPLEFDTKSTTTARELFYFYDAVGHFNARQSGVAGTRAIDYINFRALGWAILLAHEPATVEYLLRDKTHVAPRRSVVLIDEIDKAPRDFPNDVLNEIERMRFSVPELAAERNGDITFTAPREMRPVVIITSNSEKNLPEAFLRRCIYADIAFPSATELQEIVEARMPELISRGAKWVTEAIELLEEVRRSATLAKRPATAEFLSWIVALDRMGADPTISLRTQPAVVDQTIGVLVKASEDVATAQQVVETWMMQRPA